MATANIYDLVDTWNEGATAFTAIKMDVTDTASASDSLLMDLLVGGSSKFKIDKNGYLRGASASSAFLRMDDVVGVDLAYNTASLKIVSDYASISRANFGFAGSNNFGSLVFGGMLGFRPNASVGPADLFLFRDAANSFGQRNGTNAQTFNLYNTYTDGSNYERARMGWASNAFEIAPQAAGTGTTRVLHISGLPTSDPGTGILWNDGGTVKVGS